MAADQKRAADNRAWLVFFDESGISLLPVTRRSWSPKGSTPILRHRYNHWKRASMAGALGDHAADATRGPRPAAVLPPHLKPDSYDTVALVEVLTQLGAFYAGERVVLLWDGLGAHRSHAMRDWVATQHAWLTVQRLPSYAPELNPVEDLWANLKAVELANFAGDQLVEVADTAERGIHRVCDDDRLVWSFLAHSGLALDHDIPTDF